ncbi:hypothetical protein GW17_00022347 [Ensete ventricosum]|nr:hypothetical protein GW17_00022347 [Ensete ventricosum]
MDIILVLVMLFFIWMDVSYKISVTLQYLMPFVEQEQYEISSKCRLHPDNDMFREQEQHKIHVETNEWRCGFCKKSFRAEKFLDQHFDNRHYNLLNYVELVLGLKVQLFILFRAKDNAWQTCVGHCIVTGWLSPRRPRLNAIQQLLLGTAIFVRFISSHVIFYLNMSGLLLNRRVFSDGGIFAEFFLRQFCDAHTCTGGKKPFSRGGKVRFSLVFGFTQLVMLYCDWYGFRLL